MSLFNSAAAFFLAIALGGLGFPEPAASTTVSVIVQKKPKPISITIDFDSEEKIQESADTGADERKAEDSGLTPDQRKAAIAQVQKEYDAALGNGKVKVTEGSGGDVEVIVTGGKSNDGNAPDKGGNAGRKNKPAIVYVGAIKEGLKPNATELATAVGEIAAHESGHKFGLSHNCDRMRNKMSGAKCPLSREDLVDGKLEFNKSDANKLKINIDKRNREKASKRKKSKKTSDTSVESKASSGSRFSFIQGDVLGISGFHPFDIYPEAAVSLIGDGALDVGFLGLEEEFIFIGENYSGDTVLDYFTFVHGGFLDFALRDSVTGEIVSLSGGDALMKLGPKNPYNTSVSRSVSFEFSGLAAPATLTLDLLLDETGLFSPKRLGVEDPCCLYGQYTGGFSEIPLPPTILLLLSSALSLATMRKRRQVS